MHGKILKFIVIAYINQGPREDRKPLRWFSRRFLNEGTGQWSGQVKRVWSTRNEKSGKSGLVGSGGPGESWTQTGGAHPGRRCVTGTRCHLLSQTMKREGNGEHCLLPASIALWCLPLPDPISSVHFSRSVVSDSLQPHEPQHARPPYPSPTPTVYPNPCPSSW